MLDKNDLVVLREYEDNRALLFDEGAPSPFIVAHGFDKENMEWAYGVYFTDPVQASLAADPEILDGACVIWGTQDLEANWTAELEDMGLSSEEIAESFNSPEYEDFKDTAIDALSCDNFIYEGNEVISDAASDMALSFANKNKETSR